MKLGIGLLLLCIHLTSSTKLELVAESVDRSHARFGKKNIQLQSPTETSVKLSNFQDFLYYAKIKLGETQTFNVLMDTGSSTFWVPSKYGDDSVTKAKLNTYDRKSSATYKPVEGHTAFEQVYATGIIDGLYASDKLQVGGITIENQAFIEVVCKKNFPKDQDKFDGIMGFGIPKHDFRMLSVISNLIDKKLIKEPLVSFFFNRKTTNNVGGEVTFGSIDTTKCKTEVVYMPLSKNPDYVAEASEYWAIDIEKIIVNGIVVHTEKMLTAVDSGTSPIVGPTDVVNKIFKHIPNTKVIGENLTCKCKDAKKLPTITFLIYGKEFDLKGEDYTYKCSKEDENECCIGIARSDELTGLIFGQTFLGNFLSVFHYGKNQIGFAELA